MTDYSEAIKGIGAATASGLIKPIFDTWLKPCLEAWFKKKKLNDELIEHYFNNKFEKYMETALESNSYLNTIVFPNQQIKLIDFYLPLTLKTVKQGKNIEYYINQFPKEFLTTKMILLVDTAGMGKSTLLKYLFLSSVGNNVGIPVFVELRRLNSKTHIYAEVIKELTSIEDKVDKSFIDELINRGDFIFFLDGFDEIPSNEKETVLRDLNSFIRKARNNTFIITSRPETELISLGSFQQFNLKPLEIEEAYNLITTYDDNGELSKILIEKLEEIGEDDNLIQFLINPLMVSLLYKAFAHKQMLPFKKHDFYRQVYDALFEEHDLTKVTAFIRDKECGLDSDAFHSILRKLGYDTKKLGKIEYDKDELVRLVNQAKANYPKTDFSTTMFIKDLITTVPLFVREGNYYRWAHKSIQEYFAACFIFCDSKEMQNDILLKMYENPVRYNNVLDIYYDMDYKTFRNTILKKFIEEYISYCNLVVKKDSNIDFKMVLLRYALLYESDILFVNCDKASGDIFKYFLSTLKEYIDYEPVATSTVWTEPLWFIQAYKPKFVIIDLLFNKGENLFYKKSQLPTKKIDLPKSVFSEFSYNIKVTDDPNLPMNQKKYYEMFNVIMLQGHRKFLNYEKCKLALEQILNDNRKNAYSSLLDGL